MIMIKIIIQHDSQYPNYCSRKPLHVLQVLYCSFIISKQNVRRYKVQIFSHMKTANDTYSLDCLVHSVQKTVMTAVHTRLPTCLLHLTGSALCCDFQHSLLQLNSLV